MRITALERRPRRRHIEVHLERGPALPISAEVCLQFGLRVGDEISDTRLEELRHAEARREALAAALRLLTYRPRSEGEMRTRLARRGVDSQITDETVGRLRELGLLDDEAFSSTFVESRDRMSPRSRRAIAAELSGKWVERGVASRAAAAVDDADAAYRALERRLRSVVGLPWPDFRRRLGDFLSRRGFDHETINTTVARAWKDGARGATGEGDDDAGQARSKSVDDG